ncbi:MAG: 4Fe-4S binding protein [Oscillospiraceae bacterium]|nr:4Fe-4S binding protein [Oscillospiraceae bacterium]
MAKIKIDENFCKGCGLCVTVCPKKIIEIMNGKLNLKGYNPAGVTDAEKCTGCASCAMICPDCAITIDN